MGPDPLRRALAIAGLAALAAPALLRGGRALAASGYEISFDSNLATVGNSLIDQSVDMLHHFSRRSRRGRGALAHQTIPGAPMKWNWDHAHQAVTNVRALLAEGRQHAWMGVESVPFRHLQGPGDPCDVSAWSDWSRLARDNGVTRLFLFEAWHDLRSGRPDYEPEDRADPDTGIPWRERIDVARPFWEGIVDHVDAGARPGEPPMALIPGGRLFAAIHDDIIGGRVPAGLSRIEDLFADSIHPNHLGRYAMACAMFACIYRESPVGLAAGTADVYGRAFPRLLPDLAGYFQARAWSVSTADERSGL